MASVPKSPNLCRDIRGTWSMGHSNSWKRQQNSNHLGSGQPEKEHHLQWIYKPEVFPVAVTCKVGPKWDPACSPTGRTLWPDLVVETSCRWPWSAWWLSTVATRNAEIMFKIQGKCLSFKRDVGWIKNPNGSSNVTIVLPKKRWKISATPPGREPAICTSLKLIQTSHWLDNYTMSSYWNRYGLIWDDKIIQLYTCQAYIQ